MRKILRRIAAAVSPAAGIAALLCWCSPAAATLINFDNVASGTQINTTYAGLGVSFNNPLGVSLNNPDSPNIYALASSTNASPGNVVSVFDSGVPAFDARYGAVEAVFSQAQHTVSIDAAILRLPEGFGTPQNAPRLEIYGIANNLITVVNFDFTLVPQPGVGGISAFETLAFTGAGNDIGRVRFLSGQPGGSPSNFGLFDNLNFARAGDVNTVPEPGSMALGGVALAGLLAARRRRG